MNYADIRARAGILLLAASLGAALPLQAAGEDQSRTNHAGVETRIVSLTDTIRGKRVMQADLPALRAALHDEARAACERLRREVGSCVIRSVVITERENALYPGEFFVRARALLLWLNPGGSAGDAVTTLPHEAPPRA